MQDPLLKLIVIHNLVLAQQDSSRGGVNKHAFGRCSFTLEPLNIPEVLLNGNARKVGLKELLRMPRPELCLSAAFRQGREELGVPPGKKGCQRGVQRPGVPHDKS